MKEVKIIRGDKHNTKALLFEVVRASPTKAIGFDEMKIRVDVLDKLEALTDTDEILALENAEHSMLVAALKNFPFNVAHRDIVDIIEAVQGAKVTPTKEKTVKEK
jgi:hypothetical protein